MIVNPASIAFLLLLAPATYAASNQMKVKTCNANSRKCSVEMGGFGLDRPAGEISQIDLGPGRSYSCTSNGKPKGRGATFHAECSSSSDISNEDGNGSGGKGSGSGGKGNGSGGKGNSKSKGSGGAMNVIKRGKNSRGQDLIFGSVNVDGEICQIGPDATGEETVVDCTPEDEFDDESEDDPNLATASVLISKGDRFRKLVTDPVDQLKQQTNVSLRGSSSGSHQRGLVDDLGGTLDTMVLWTAMAECENSDLGSVCTLTSTTEENMRGLIDLAIAETNTAYELSGIDTELRLVHAYRELGYTELTSNPFADALNKITSQTDGVMDDVHTKRNTYGADIVAMLTHSPTTACGRGHIGPREDIMFSITNWKCATGYYSFGHEIGHNMGCWHDRGVLNQCSSTDYHFGYRDPQAGFRSMLAYGCTAGQCDNNAGGGCTRVQRISNPTLGYNGSPIGTAQSDNARHIREVKAEIAGYRAFVTECAVNSECDDNDPCTTDICDGVCVNDPITCDDGNACTADSCSGGSCLNTDISASCDDGNSCTNDSCNALGGCSNEFKSNCCGNFICEAGEDTDNCFGDCAVGPFTLATTVCSSCFGSHGNMFDVEAKNADISIISLKMYIYVGAVAEVWTRPDSHVGFSLSSTGWTKVAEHDFSSVGQFTMNEIPESSFTEVLIPAGKKQAFYVTLRTGGMVIFGAGDGSAAEDVNMLIYEGPYKDYQFGGDGDFHVWNGEMTYMKDGTTTTLAPTPKPTPFPLTPVPTPLPTPNPTLGLTPNPTADPTPNPTPNPTAEPTDEPTSGPSKSPTPSPVTAEPTNFPTTEPTKAPTPLPTDEPTPAPSKSPTPLPVTVEPTNFPTDEPTKVPTPLPTDEPTPAPSNSLTPAPVTPEPTNFPTRQPTDVPTPGPSNTPTAPTVFVPEVVDLVKNTNSATIIRAAYFEVQGGDVWAKITNLKIITYRTRSIEVYYKYGSATPYEATPCAWKKIAETSSSWNPGYWKSVYPPWINGFEPVVLPPNEKVSFYLVNTGISYGILANSHSNSNRYLSPWMSLDATSPVGAITMSHGKGGYLDQRFKPNPDYYRGYGIWGGLRFETMQPGSTEAPTTAPTEPTTPGAIESPLTGTSTERVHGLQFDVENLGSDDIIVKKLSVLMADAGTHHLEVWYRDGSHTGSGSGCNNWNNWCNTWTKLTGTNVFSSGSDSFAATPTFVAIVKAGAITSFAVVSPNSRLLSQTSSTSVDNGLLRINPATPINDYYRNNVQTIHALSTSELLFEGTIDYEVAHSECAVHSQASWVVLDPIGSMDMDFGDKNADADVAGGEVEEVVYAPMGELEEEE